MKSHPILAGGPTRGHDLVIGVLLLGAALIVTGLTAIVTLWFAMLVAIGFPWF